MKSSLVNGEVFIVALIDFIRSLTNQVLDTVPGPSLTRNVEERSLLLPGEPMVLSLLSKQLQYIHLVTVDGVVDGTLQLVR